MVPETDRGLQECDDNGLDIFLEKRYRSVRPHPQVQTPADVSNARQIKSACHLKPVKIIIICSFAFTNELDVTKKTLF